MTDKNELKNEELKEVNGGWRKSLEYYTRTLNFKHMISKDEVENHKGGKVLLQTYNGNFVYGDLKNVYDKSDGCDHYKMATMYVEDSDYATVGIWCDYKIADYDFYIAE